MYVTISGQLIGLFPSGFHFNYLLGFLSSSILITCLYHLNLFLSISSNNGVTCNTPLMSVLLILSLHVTPLIILRTLISASCILDSTLVVNDQTSDPYSKMGFGIIWYMVILHPLGIFTSQSKGYFNPTLLLYLTILLLISISCRLVFHCCYYL